MGVVTSIDPEILLLDEGIGAVDADFLKKAQSRLQSLVERSGILVFASHSNEFLARLCKTAMWIDHGTVRMEGNRRGGRGAYEGPDAARHVREVPEGEPGKVGRAAMTGYGAPSSSPTAGRDELAAVPGRGAHPDPAIDHLIVVDNDDDSWCRDPGAANRSRRPISARAEISAVQGFALRMLQALALGADWIWLADDDGRPRRRPWLLGLRGPARLAEVSPMVCDMGPDRLAFLPAAGLAASPRRRTADRGRAGSAARVSPLFNGALFRAKAIAAVGVRTCGCSSAGDEYDVHRRLVRSGLPSGTRLDAVPALQAATSSSRFWRRMHTQYPDDPTKRYFFTYRNRGYLLSQPGCAVAAAGMAAVRLVLPGDAP